MRQFVGRDILDVIFPIVYSPFEEVADNFGLGGEGRSWQH